MLVNTNRKPGNKVKGVTLLSTIALSFVMASQTKTMNVHAETDSQKEVSKSISASADTTSNPLASDAKTASSSSEKESSSSSKTEDSSKTESSETKSEDAKTDTSDYTVNTGDTLFDIATEHNTTVQAIIEMNQDSKLSQDSIIRQGDTIHLAKTTENTTAPKTHSVVSGNTLSGIATQYHLTLQQIFDYNTQYSLDNTVIYPGDTIQLEQTKAAQTETTTQEAATPAETAEPVQTQTVQTETAEPAETQTTTQQASSAVPTGAHLTSASGVFNGPSGKETYYNLDMSTVVSNAKSMGAQGSYWVRSDGAKMLGNYVMVAANLSTHPRLSIVPTSLGSGIVVDTGGFAASNANQLDIATNW